MIDLRTELRIAVSLALTMVPRTVRRDYSEKLLIRSDPAKEKITEAVVEALLKTFAVEKKPLPTMPSIDFDTRAVAAIERQEEAARAPMPVAES